MVADVASAAFLNGGNYRRRDSGQVKPLKKRVFHLRGNNSIDIPYPDTDIDTVEHALYSRVFTLGGKPLPKPVSRAHVRKTVELFVKRMRQRAAKREVQEPLTRQEFVDEYCGPKKRIYQNAKERMDLFEIPLRKMAKIKCFIKLEAVKKDPRLISTRDPTFHLEFGRYVKVLEKAVYEDINYLFWDARRDFSRVPTILKSLNQRERGGVIAEKWHRFHDPVFVGLDVSRFDAHVSDIVMELLEHPCYKDRVRDHSDKYSLNRLLRLTLFNVGSYKGEDGTISYRVKGSRASGDMNTSLGNCTIMSGLLYSYLSSKGLLDQVEVIDDGDDAGIILEGHKLAQIRDIDSWYLAMGFTLKVEPPVHTIEAIEFCRCHPIWTPQGYVLCPNPYRRLYTDVITDKPLHNETTWRKWVGAVAGCGLAGCGGLPMFQAFYTYLAQSAGMAWVPFEGSFYHRYRNELVNSLEIKKRPVHVSTRVSFYRAYGILPDHQEVLERDILSRDLLSFGVSPIRGFYAEQFSFEVPCSVTSSYDSLMFENR